MTGDTEWEDGFRAPRAPAHVQPYVDVLGEKEAMAFLLEFGGAEVYLPASPRSRSLIVQRIGQDRTLALAQALSRMMSSGQKLRVPTAKPWLAVCMRHEGMTTADIARRLHVTDATVRGWFRRKGRRRPPPKFDPRQLKLF